MIDLPRRLLAAITAVGLTIVAQLVTAEPTQAQLVEVRWPPVVNNSVECEDGNDPFNPSLCPFFVDFGAPVDREVRFYAETLPGTALPEQDYVPLRETPVTVRQGESGVTITVAIINDGRCEPKETFILRLWGGEQKREAVEYTAWIADTAC